MDKKKDFEIQFDNLDLLDNSYLGLFYVIPFLKCNSKIKSATRQQMQKQNYTLHYLSATVQYCVINNLTLFVSST